MSVYKNFAVAGAGNIGKAIVGELIRKKDAGVISSVIVLTRSPDKHKDLAARGVVIAVVDYTSQTSLKSALLGSDIVISVLNPVACEPEMALAKAAKAAGVKLFSPSDYGCDPLGETENILFKHKLALLQTLKELELPYAVFYTGMLTELDLSPGFAESFGFNFAESKFTIPGSGNAPISWTTMEETVRFVVHVFTALPRENVEWRIFRIEGERISLNEILAAWQKRSGKTLSISHRPHSELEDAVKKNPADEMALLTLQMDLGHILVGKPEELSNAELHGWKLKKVIEVLLEIYGK